MTDRISQHDFLRIALFWNGVADILASVLLVVFPAVGLALPGYGRLEYQAAFAAGGWGIAALTFGIGRIWASRRPGHHRFMAILGLFEGATLTLYCLARVAFSPTTLLQAALPLAIAVVFGAAYAAGLRMRAN